VTTKILHVLDHSLPALSGYSTRSWNIVTFQRALGLQPIVLTSPKHPKVGPNPELLDGIPHYRSGSPSTGFGRFAYVGEAALMSRLARRIIALARAEHVDVIHAHSPALNGLPALWAGRRLGIPVVYESRAFWEDAAVDHGTTTEGSIRYRVSRELESRLFGWAQEVVVIAASMKRDIGRRGVELSKITIVPNGVDTERFSPVAPSVRLKRRFELGDDLVMGFIGSFYRYEGLRFLLESIPELRRRLPRVKVLLVGGGEEEARLRRMARDLGDAVIFAGQVPYSEIPEYYSLVDIFVCPRLRMRLTELVTPLKPLEAMAMGRVVLGSDVGGMAELIQNTVTGSLFRAESHKDFVEAVVELGTRPDLRAVLGKRARQAVVEERTWRQVVAAYLPVYRRLS
jgi:PEP-CTERM/exosortase A-associated glycosyltransferase